MSNVIDKLSCGNVKFGRYIHIYVYILSLDKVIPFERQSLDFKRE